MSGERLIMMLHPFTFPELTEPYGHLSRDMRAQACWYFYTLAQKQYENVPAGDVENQFGLLEGELWMDVHYHQLARSVAMLYALESPDEFAKAWDQVRAQAKQLELPEPKPAYTRLVPMLYKGIN